MWILVVGPPHRDYRDAFGNICTRLIAPTGLIEIRNRFIVSDSGRPDYVVPGARQFEIEQLPDGALVYLLGSRYLSVDIDIAPGRSDLPLFPGLFKRLSAQTRPRKKERLPRTPVVTRSSTVGLDQWGFMLVFRYFVFVGSVLFGLLLAADRYLPAPVERSAAIDVDRSIIRIRSARNLPEKIVFDAANEPVVMASCPAEIEQREHPRHALAMTPQDSRAAQPAPVPVARVAERHASRPLRALRKPTEPRVAMDHHELFGGW